MDPTVLADPVALTKLLTGALGLKLGGAVAAFLMWQGFIRNLLKPLSKQIQGIADAFDEFHHKPGNTEIHQKVELIESKTWAKIGFWLLDLAFSIKLGSQRETTITTTTETATVTTKKEVAAPVDNETTVIEKTTESAVSTTRIETPTEPVPTNPTTSFKS